MGVEKVAYSYCPVRRRTVSYENKTASIRQLIKRRHHKISEHGQISLGINGLRKEERPNDTMVADARPHSHPRGMEGLLGMPVRILTGPIAKVVPIHPSAKVKVCLIAEEQVLQQSWILLYHC
jgi:hypothetical protein